MADEHVDLVALLDQFKRSLTDIADVLATYRDELRQRGFEPNEISLLLVALQSDWMGFRGGDDG